MDTERTSLQNVLEASAGQEAEGLWAPHTQLRVTKGAAQHIFLGWGPPGPSLLGSQRHWTTLASGEGSHPQLR